MSKINISLKTKTNKKAVQAIEEMEEGHVKVGWVKGDKYPDKDIYVAEVAYLNENGHVIKRNGKEIGYVPPRPFLAITMADNGDRWRFIWKKLYKQVVEGKIPLEMALKKLGETVRASIKDTIWSSVPPPNAPSTIKHKKGRTTTLIDTGLMLKTINYVYKVGK